MKYNHLPHIDIDGYYQFITFRTYDSTDDYLLKLYSSTNIEERKKQLAIDTYLDQSSQGAYLRGEVLHYFFNFLLSKDKILYQLIAFVIMPNHTHLLIKPLESLDRVMKKIKGASAKEINTLLHKEGRFWARDYFDRGIRDEKHFDIVYTYIKNNPLKLADAEERRFYGVFE
jgi:REP element-mobilizing transposase RayT